MKVIAVLRKSNSLVYIRVMFGRDKDVKVSTSMHIDPIYWDSKIPGYKNTKKVPKEVREKFNNTLKEMIAYVEANVDKDVTCPVLSPYIPAFILNMTGILNTSVKNLILQYNFQSSQRLGLPRRSG